MCAALSFGPKTLLGISNKHMLTANQARENASQTTQKTNTPSAGISPPNTPSPQLPENLCRCKEQRDGSLGSMPASVAKTLRKHKTIRRNCVAVSRLRPALRSSRIRSLAAETKLFRAQFREAVSHSIVAHRTQKKQAATQRTWHRGRIDKRSTGAIHRP